MSRPIKMTLVTKDMLIRFARDNFTYSDNNDDQVELLSLFNKLTSMRYIFKREDIMTIIGDEICGECNYTTNIGYGKGRNMQYKISNIYKFKKTLNYDAFMFEDIPTSTPIKTPKNNLIQHKEDTDLVTEYTVIYNEHEELIREYMKLVQFGRVHFPKEVMDNITNTDIYQKIFNQ